MLKVHTLPRMNKESEMKLFADYCPLGGAPYEVPCLLWAVYMMWNIPESRAVGFPLRFATNAEAVLVEGR